MQMNEIFGRMIMMPIDTLAYGADMLAQTVKSVQQAAEKSLGIDKGSRDDCGCK